MAISAASMIGFIVWEFRVEHPLVDLRILKSRNFRTGLMLMTVVGVILFGTTAELPLFLQTLMGYPALQSGYTMSPRGVAAFITTFIVGRLLVGRVPSRWLLCFGFSVLAYSAFLLADINLQVSQASVIFPTVINGLAISFIFVPLTTTTMSQLSQRQIGSATGLYNLMLNLGGSIGIATVTTMIARGSQSHQALMVGQPDAGRSGLHRAAPRGASHARPARRSGDRGAPGPGAHLRPAQPAGAFVGVCGHVPDFRSDCAVLHPADFPVQTRPARAGAAGGRALNPKPKFNHG